MPSAVRLPPPLIALSLPAVVPALVAALLMPGGVADAAGKPEVRLSASQAGTGGSVMVSGSGWRPHTLLTMLVCGQSAPSRGVPGGTGSCADADGRAVTTDARGRFERALPVAEPPVPCPCVVHVATATGPKARADAALQVAGHAVEPLPAQPGGGRLAVLTAPRLDGSGGLLTWFGAPPERTLVLTVGNVGTSAVKDPVFQVGTSHGVFAPRWEERRWRGTIRPGQRARVVLPVSLAAGAHGDHTVSLKHGGRVMAEQPWAVSRPWGVTLFRVLACLVVPAALFRAGTVLVDRVRPPGAARRRGGPRLPRLPVPHLSAPRSHAARPRAPCPSSGAPDPASPTLPWFTPDAGPGALSAPHDDTPADSETGI
ncbi:hypothetical protein [Streptomyces sp. NPDC093094]|uniref:hypothetical protein n=1 Tax=Streptomyces sp. NPDC093094 TaxID=3366026 RepID=UPI00380C3E48